MHADYLEKMADAAEDGDWRRALALATSMAPLVKIDDIVSTPMVALRVSRVAMHASYGLNRELLRLFSRELGSTPATVESFPPQLCDAMFTGGRRRLHDALEADRWADAAAFLQLLLLLPAANSTRAEVLKSDMIAIIQRMNDEQAACLNAPLRAPWQRNEPPPAVRSIPRLVGVVAQSEYFPELAYHFLCALLANAERPILQTLDAATVLLAWPELMRLIQDRSASRAMTESAREWLQRATALDPEPYAPDEFDEGENS